MTLLRWLPRLGLWLGERPLGRGRDQHRGGCVVAHRLFVGDRDDDDGDVVDATRTVRGVDEPGCGALGVALASELGRDRVLVHHVGEAVGAQHDEVAGNQLHRVHVDVDALVDAQRARDHGSHRMYRGFVLGDLAVAHELFDVAVIGGEAAELTVAEQIRARVTDVPDE
jgi:hypothetical protein